MKYGSEIKKINGCPPTPLSAIDTVAYRFAHASRNDPRNYLPIAKITPSRKIDTKEATECCSAFALSMYSELTTLQAKLRSVLKLVPNFQQRVGTHYVAIKVNTLDGMATRITSTGHFDFFESETFKCENAILTHEHLLP